MPCALIDGAATKSPRVQRVVATLLVTGVLCDGLAHDWSIRVLAAFPGSCRGCLGCSWYGKNYW